MKERQTHVPVISIFEWLVVVEEFFKALLIWGEGFSCIGASKELFRDI